MDSIFTEIDSFDVAIELCRTVVVVAIFCFFFFVSLDIMLFYENICMMFILWLKKKRYENEFIFMHVF